MSDLMREGPAADPVLDQTERVLHTACSYWRRASRLRDEVKQLREEADRLEAAALAELRTPVDAFFEDVMVNAEQLDLRLNRLGLLKSLHIAMNRVADLSKLAA